MSRIGLKASAAMLSLLCASCMIGGPASLAQETSKPASTSSPVFNSSSLDPNQWFRVIPQVNDGPVAEAAGRIYARIAGINRPRKDPKRLDTVIEYGPGHWTFEWEHEAESVLKRGQEAEKAGKREEAGDAYLSAAQMYALGSYPHLRSDTYAMAALDKARAAYQAGAKLLFGGFRVVTVSHAGKSFQGYLFLPPGKGPFPLVVYTYGSDWVKEQAPRSLLQKELERRGIGLFLVDLPGIGSSAAYDLTPDSDEILVASVEYLRKDPAIDPKRVAVAGLSFGGNAAARALFRPELNLAGVVSMCGPLHTSFMLPPAMLSRVAPLQIAGVRDRVGLAPESSDDDLSAAVKPFSFKTRALLEPGKKVSTPLLIIATDADRVAPVADLPLISDATTRAKTLIMHQEGHCADPLVADPTSAAWLEGLLKPAKP